MFGGRRVSKSSSFIELVGELDELQAVMGWARCGAKGGGGGDGSGDGSDPMEYMGEGGGDSMYYMGEVLDRIQDDLYRMMSIVGLELKCPSNIKPIGEADVEFLENEMSKYEKTMQNLNAFIRPGTTEAAARLNIARTVCRRVERRMVKMMIGDGSRKDVHGNGQDGQGGYAKVSQPFLKYLNRLSDLLFVLAYQFEKG